MLARLDEANPRLRITQHAITVSTVPLLSGEWFYSSKCFCSTATHGFAPTHRRAEAFASKSLRCHTNASRIHYQEVRNAASARRAIRAAGYSTPIVVAPYGQAALAKKKSATVIAVDASYRRGTIGIAAVTGAGWVQLGRVEGAHGYQSREAEFLAMTTGVELAPHGTALTVHMDNRGVADTINTLMQCGFPADMRPPWLSVRNYDRLRHIMYVDRHVTVQWRRRNSTEMLELADWFSKRCSTPKFAPALVSARLSWERGIGRSGDQHQYIVRVEYPYRATTGEYLFSDVHALYE